MPYLSVYLTCTYLSVRVVKDSLAGRTQAFRLDVAALLLGTAALASVRIPGLAIVVQYLLTFSLADRALAQGATRESKLLRLPAVFGFAAALLALVIAAYPAVWTSPLAGTMAALKYMGGHPWSGCTLTWGQCLPAQHLPWYYLPGWLVVKLPIFALIGLALLPFVRKRISADPLHRIAFGTLAFGSCYLLVAAIVFRPPLYDETRHFLFVYPLLFLMASIGLHTAWPKVSVMIVASSVAVFAWDHVRLYPYQYIYFNEAARFLDIDSLFDTDLRGASSRELAGAIAAQRLATAGAGCIFAEPAHLYRPFIGSQLCVRDLGDAYKYPPEGSFVVAAYKRELSVLPGTCRPIAQVSRTLPLSERKMTLALAGRCE
jgi:hypothetical protein